MKLTAMALCGFKCAGQSSTISSPRGAAPGRRSDVEYAGLDATGAEAAPMRLGQTQDERVFGCIVRLKGLAKPTENRFVPDARVPRAGLRE